MRRTLFLAGAMILAFTGPGLVGDVAGVTAAQFQAAVNIIHNVPYNPRPIATDTMDVTHISEADTLTDFFAEFTRVTIHAPRNGSTFQASVSGNDTDIVLVAYQRLHGTTPPPPAIVLTHGGSGEGSIATHQGFLLHIARVLYANGYDVLAVDLRDGLLSRCAYTGSPPTPDPSRSKPWKAGVLDSDPDADAEKTDFCDTLPSAFIDTTYDAHTGAVSSFGAFEAGDILAAAKYVQAQTGTSVIGALSGSLGGLALIRAATLQGAAGTDFPAGLLSAILAFSPFGDWNTTEMASSSTSFSCLRAKAAKAYSGVPGTGLGDFTADPAGTTSNFYALLNGIGAIASVTIPALTLHTLSDDQVFANTALAFQATTNAMPLAQSLIMTRTGHFHEMWQADPFWADRVTLIYFKRMLAPGNAAITVDPGFAKLGPNSDNPLLMHFNLGATALDKLVVSDPYSAFLQGVCY